MNVSTLIKDFACRGHHTNQELSGDGQVWL